MPKTDFGNLSGRLIFWLFPATAITLMAGLIYVGVQQNYRQSANDPQIEMAEDASAILSHNPLPESVLQDGNVDIRSSLSPFLIVYDNTGNPLASEATLDGSPPKLPHGVFGHVQKYGEDRITWQPEGGVRIAAIIVPFHAINSSGFVLAGRSLREVEKREGMLSFEILAIWIILMIISFVGVVFVIPRYTNIFEK